MNRDLPKISIVTPSFQQGEYIETTIRSVLDQNYPNLEYFIIDGGSTDNSVEIIKKYESQISGWVSEKDRGQSHAINKGFSKCSGDIMTWLNSDDHYESGALLKVAEHFRDHPKCMVVYGNTRLFNGKGWSKIEGKKVQKITATTIAGIPFSQPSSFLNGKIYQENRITVREDLHFGMDYDLFLRLKQFGSYDHIEMTIANYLVHKDSKTSNHNIKFAEDWNKVYQSALSSFNNDHGILTEIDQLGLKVDALIEYDLNLNPSKEDLWYSFFLYLKWQSMFRFEARELDHLANILNFVFANFTEAQNDPELNEIRKRIKNFPKTYFLLKDLKKRFKI